MQEREKEVGEVTATTLQDTVKKVEAVFVILFRLREVLLLCTICTQQQLVFVYVNQGTEKKRKKKENCPQTWNREPEPLKPARVRL